MENLQPLEAYMDDVRALSKRLKWGSGLAFGVLMALLTPFGVPQEFGVGGVFACAIFVLIVGGGSFGILWSWTMGLSMRAMIKALYSGSSRFEVDIPTGNYRYRLPASFRPSDRFAIGGVLFLGTGAMAFVPHRGNLPTHRKTLILPIRDDFRVETIPQNTTWFRSLMVGSLPDLMHVESDGESWNFLVPLPQETANRVRNVVEVRQ